MNINFDIEQFLIPYTDILTKTGVSRLNYYKYIIEKSIAYKVHKNESK